MTATAATNNISLVTFPRSGLHFFATAWGDLSGQTLHTTHFLEEANDQVITIVRDPFESISSWVSMNLQLKTVDDLIEDQVNYEFDRAVSFYKNLQTKLIDVADVVIDFNSLPNINNFLPKILHHYAIEPIRESVFPELITQSLIANEDTNSWFRPTSKALNSYVYIQDILKGKDLSDCYKIYDDLIERKTQWLEN